VADVRGIIDEVVVVEDQQGTHLAEGLQVANERIEHGIERGTPRPDLAQQRRRCRSECLLTGLARRNEMVEERHPASIVLAKAVPERAKPGSTPEVGQQRRLAVPGLGDHVDHSVVDLDLQPVEEPVARQRLLTERGPLHLCGLNRVRAHGALQCRGGGRRRGSRPAGTHGDQRSNDASIGRRGWLGRAER
jgi:hypothetical protein